MSSLCGFPNFVKAGVAENGRLFDIQYCWYTSSLHKFQPFVNLQGFMHPQLALSAPD